MSPPTSDSWGAGCASITASPSIPPAELKTGSRFKQTLKVAGTKFLVEWTATEVDGPGRLAWDGEGPAGTAAHTSYTLEAERRRHAIRLRERVHPAGREDRKGGGESRREAGRQAGKRVPGEAEGSRRGLTARPAPLSREGGRASVAAPSCRAGDRGSPGPARSRARRRRGARRAAGRGLGRPPGSPSAIPSPGRRPPRAATR